MGRRLRNSLIALGLLVAVVGAIVFFVATNLDRLAEAAIEQYGSEALGVALRVDSVHLSPAQGTGRINGLTIANPPGFSTASAVRAGQIDIAFSVAALAKKPIVVREIVASEVQVTYEFAGDQSNLGALQKSAGAAKGGAAPKKGADEPSVVVEKLIIRDGIVYLRGGALGPPGLDVPLGTIRLNNVGKGGGGAGEIVAQVLPAIIGATVRAVATLDLERLLGGAEGGGKALKTLIEKGGKDLGSALGTLFGN
jgi:hypothetical protein